MLSEKVCCRKVIDSRVTLLAIQGSNTLQTIQRSKEGEEKRICLCEILPENRISLCEITPAETAATDIVVMPIKKYEKCFNQIKLCELPIPYALGFLSKTKIQHPKDKMKYSNQINLREIASVQYASSCLSKTKIQHPKHTMLHLQDMTKNLAIMNSEPKYNIAETTQIRMCTQIGIILGTETQSMSLVPYEKLDIINLFKTSNLDNRVLVKESSHQNTNGKEEVLQKQTDFKIWDIKQSQSSKELVMKELKETRDAVEKIKPIGLKYGTVFESENNTNQKKENMVHCSVDETLINLETSKVVKLESPKVCATVAKFLNKTEPGKAKRKNTMKLRRENLKLQNALREVLGLRKTKQRYLEIHLDSVDDLKQENKNALKRLRMAKRLRSRIAKLDDFEYEKGYVIVPRPNNKKKKD